MEQEDLARRLSHIFEDKQYKWKIDGNLVVPSYEDLLLTIEKIKETLDNEPEGTWLESGRLIFIKTVAGLDVYVLQGTLDEPQSKDK
jgi:hypothetical protein